MRLRDKVAVITGGGAGIGRATALLFGRKGAKVVVADISEEHGRETVAMIRREGPGDGRFVHADVSARDQVEGLFDRVMEQFGRVDILVNNAYGSVQGDGDLLDVTEETWDRIMGVTLKSVYLCSQRAVREMLKSGGGSVVNLSSVNALGGYGVIAYSTAKGGIISFTRAAAIAYGDRGIRFNVVCPGTIETSSTKPFFDAYPGLLEKTGAMYPIGRIGRPEEVAYLILYLASDESSFTTGAVFTIDGGLTAGRKLELTELARKMLGGMDSTPEA